MKANRITSCVVFALALMVALGQLANSGAHAQAAGKISSTVSAQVSVANDAKSASGQGSASPADQAPYHITVQGRLTDPNGNPITTASSITFRLYAYASGGNPFFTESATVTPSSNGLFTYLLGSNTPFILNILSYFDSNIWLGITVASDAEMTPRFPLTASPYAMSLAPGATVYGSVPEAHQSYFGAINVINTDYTDPLNAGLYGAGALGVYGSSTTGVGLYGQSFGASGQQQSAGVTGISYASNGVGGVFTDTQSGGVGVNGHGVNIGVEGSSTGSPNGYGVLGISAGSFGYGVFGSGFQGVTGYSSNAGGYGVYGSSTGSQGYGVTGISYASNGVGGVFTDTQSGGVGVNGHGVNIGVEGSSTGSPNGYGVLGSSTGSFGYGVLGSGFQGVTGYSSNAGGYGVYGSSTGSQGYGVSGISYASNGVGGVFKDTQSGGVGGVFTATTGVVADGGGATIGPAGDGLDVGGGGGGSYAILSTQPVGDSNYTLYGVAHIHGSNISAANYSVEVVYHGSATAQIGDVLALDGINRTDNGTIILGVVRAAAANADAAVGVLDKRLDSVRVNGVAKTIIDGQATSIKPGDHAYVVIVGSTRMKVANVRIGQRLALASDGSLIVAALGENNIIGKVASIPDQDGYATVFVNLK